MKKMVLATCLAAATLAIADPGLLAKVAELWQDSNRRYVPIGGIVPWIPPSHVAQVPDGYRICNGDKVDDQASPFHGQATPQLAGRFLMGTNREGVRGTGGNSSVNLSHTHEVKGGTGELGGEIGWGQLTGGNGAVKINHGTDKHTHTIDITSGASPEGWKDFDIRPSYLGVIYLIRIR